MVCDLLAVDHGLNILLCGGFLSYYFLCFCKDSGNGLPHILCQIPAVRSRIGHQLFLIQALGVVQWLLGRITKSAVCFPLQIGKVKKSRWLLCLFWWHPRSTPSRYFHIPRISALPFPHCPFAHRKEQHHHNSG